MGHRPYALVAREPAADANAGGGAIRGYLPLALVRSRLFGRFLVSLPYLNRAGVVADDPATAAALIEQAVALAAEHDVQYLELRHGADAVAHDALGATRDEKVRMVLDLPADAGGLWDLIGSKVRNQIRKGEKHALSIRFGGVELLDEFYAVFAVNMRDLGTPVYGRSLFHSILTTFAGDAELAVVDYQGRVIAAAMLVHDTLRASGPATTQVPSASSLRQFNATNANMWMYHQLLLRAIVRGAAVFDFGRSSVDSGTYRFKKQWGASPHPTVWQYHVRRGDMNAMRPDNPSMQRKVAVWQKLPVWVTRMIGPTIVRGIP